MMRCVKANWHRVNVTFTKIRHLSIRGVIRFNCSCDKYGRVWNSFCTVDYYTSYRAAAISPNLLNTWVHPSTCIHPKMRFLNGRLSAVKYRRGSTKTIYCRSLTGTHQQFLQHAVRVRGKVVLSNKCRERFITDTILIAIWFYYSTIDKQ